MSDWKRPLVESLAFGSGLALVVILIARAQMLTVLEWIGRVFYIPFHASVLLSGDAQEPAPWLYHTVLFVQFCLAVFIVGWLVGRYRKRSAGT